MTKKNMSLVVMPNKVSALGSTVLFANAIGLTIMSNLKWDVR